MSQFSIYGGDWDKVSWAKKWLADGICPTCGSPCEFRELECHHNDDGYKEKRLRGIERPRGVIALCFVCHPHFEYVKKNRGKILLWLKKETGVLNRCKIKLEELDDYYDSVKREISSKLDEAEYHLDAIRYMLGESQEYRRAA